MKPLCNVRGLFAVGIIEIPKVRSDLKVALMPHSGKDDALELAKDLIAWLEERSVPLWLEAGGCLSFGPGRSGGDDEELKEAGVALVLGRRRRPFESGAAGGALRRAHPRRQPGPPGLLDGRRARGREGRAPRRVFRGDYSIEERLMLKAEVLREGKLAASSFGLNDAAVTRGDVCPGHRV